MSDRCLLYYITDRTAFPGDEPTRRLRLLDKIAEAARAGVNYIQLREKDLPIRDLESLAREAMQIFTRESKLATDRFPRTTALLINSRTDVALAVNAAGVHLRSTDISPKEVRAVWHDSCGQRRLAHELLLRDPLVAISCHSPEEVTKAATSQATFVVFSPVFEKKPFHTSQPAGLESLREACRATIPVLALGGVTLQNAKRCLEAGAAGIAAIRLFQENNIPTIVRELRSI